MLVIKTKNERLMNECFEKLDRIAENMKNDGLTGYFLSMTAVLNTLRDVTTPKKKVE